MAQHPTQKQNKNEDDKKNSNDKDAEYQRLLAEEKALNVVLNRVKEQRRKEEFIHKWLNDSEAFKNQAAKPGPSRKPPAPKKQ